MTDGLTETGDLKKRDDLGVSHKEFADLDIASLTKSSNVVYDVKGFLTGKVDGRL